MLHHVKYGENGVVAKLYVQRTGLKSFMIKGVGNKKAIIRPAYLQPLTLLEIVFEDIPHRDLLHLKETRIYRQTPTLSANVIKTSLAFFMAEVILRSIKEMETNQEMFDFLENAILQLDDCKNQLSAFPLWFLLRLSRYLGFQPLNNPSPQKPWFNLEAGTFTEIPPAGQSPVILEKEVSEEFALMLKTFSSDSFQPFKFNYRKNLLDALLFYFSIHIPEFRELRSLSVIRELFQS